MAALIAAGCALVTGVVVVPLLRIKARKRIEAVEAQAAAEAEKRWGINIAVLVCAVGRHPDSQQPSALLPPAQRTAVHKQPQTATAAIACTHRNDSGRRQLASQQLPAAMYSTTDTQLPLCFYTVCSTSKHADLVSVNSTDLQAAIDKKTGVTEPKGFVNKWYNKAKDAALYGTTVDIHEVVEEDPFIAALHARAEKFDEHAEHSFGYLQVRAGLFSTERPTW